MKQNKFFLRMKALPWRQISGILCIAIVAFCFWLDREQSQFSDKILRLHVLANSDTEEDQALKLYVRDQVLELAQPMLMGEADAYEAAATLQEQLPQLQSCAEAAVREAGYDYPVTVSVESSWFNTRVYDDFSLPAGNYESLRVIIGEGAGQNWWCVVFPPLCMATATEEVTQTAVEAGLSEQEVFLILEEGDEYVIKFRAIELWEGFKHFFAND